MTGLANGANGQALLEWIGDEVLDDCFEHEERALLSQPELSEEQLNELSWCQESLYAAAWALSLTSDLVWPDSECDLDPLFAHIPPEVDSASFVRSATLRSERELLEATDLYYCLDASLRHSELWNDAPIDTRYPMVQIVMERRRLLDWVMGSGLWSDVSLDI